jgi:DNA-binding response OmpR family regulator
MEAKKVLLLVSDLNVGNKLEQAFFQADFDVMRTGDGLRAIHLLKTIFPHAFIVEGEYDDIIMMEIHEMINASCKRTAFILLSNNKKTFDRIKALEKGADECISKMPNINELIAKVNALIRRIHVVDNSFRILRIKDLQINLDTQEVRKGGRVVELTYTQFKLLHLLASRRDYVYSRNEILLKVWGKSSFVTNRTIDVHVKRLREKLGEKKNTSKYIQTIHGLGYRFS